MVIGTHMTTDVELVGGVDELTLSGMAMAVIVEAMGMTMGVHGVVMADGLGGLAGLDVSAVVMVTFHDVQGVIVSPRGRGRVEKEKRRGDGSMHELAIESQSPLSRAFSGSCSMVASLDVVKTGVNVHGLPPRTMCK